LTVWHSMLTLEPLPPNRRTQLFDKAPMFANLKPEERHPLAEICIERRYAAGEHLFHEGQPCDGMHIIAEGRVKIVKTSPSGREITLAVDGPASSIAEVPLFDGGPYPASAVAMSDCVVLLLRKDDFHRFCHSYPEVPLKILAVVGRRLRHLVALVESVTFGSVRQRLARHLLQTREEMHSDRFTLKLTHEELAFQLGTVREVVSRNLSRFQNEGILRAERGLIEILDANALEAEAGSEY